MKKERKIIIGFTAITVVGFISVFIYSLVSMANDMTHSQLQAQLKADEEFFNTQGSFLCTVSPFNTRTDYLVSKESGWELYSERYFKKEDLLIERSNCSKNEAKK